MYNWTPEELADWQRQQMAQALTGSLAALANSDPTRTKPPVLRAKAIPAHQKATGRLRLPRCQNKTEARYQQHIEAQMATGDVVWFRFEGWTLKLAHDLRYTPDFVVMTKTGAIECHEVKGRRANGKAYYEDDARKSIAMAAAIFPFRFVMVWEKKNGGWDSREF